MKIEVLSLDRTTKNVWESFSEEYFPHICNSYAWQICAKESFFPKEQVKVIALHYGNSLIGLLPILRSKATFMRFPTRRYHSFEQSINFSDVMILPDHLEKVLTSLLENPRIYFPGSSYIKLTASGNNIPQINQIIKQSVHSVTPLVLNRNSRIIDLENDQDFFQDVLPKKQRTNHRRSIKLLSGEGKLSFEHLKPINGNTLKECWERFLAVYQQSWKHTSPRSITGVSSEYSFFNKIFQHFSNEQNLYCSFLMLNEKDVAVSWSVKYGKVGYGLQTAYVNRYENASPGAICMTEHLIDYFRNNGKRFDLMGEHIYKNKISNLAVPYCDYYLFFNGPYSTILRKLSRFSPLQFQQL